MGGMAFPTWYQVKLLIEHATGISMDALHVLLGAALFLIIAKLLRQSAASLRPWLATLILELGNEAYDLTVERWPDPGSQLGEGFKDILLTMALPTLLLLVARSHPTLLVGKPRGEGLADDNVPDRPDISFADRAAARLDNEDQ
jgi:hypothetical protein